MDENNYLNTWKEVASYVGRSTRTIQRWERHLGLPVHRPAGKLRTSVMAVMEEIDEWVRQTPAARSSRVAEAPLGGSFAARPRNRPCR